jgi:hypothetical protein
MAISGHTGTVIVGSSTLCATEWSVDLDIERLESTCFTSSGNREYIFGLKGTTGSVTSLDWVAPTYDFVAVTLTNDDVSISGSALLNHSVTTPVDGRVEYTFDIQFTGAVTVT